MELAIYVLLAATSVLSYAAMVAYWQRVSWRTGVWAGNAIFPSNEGCAECVEIDIGNDPEQQRHSENDSHVD
jgi:hypothetical protein